ncbi:uncharacterized protein LOC107826073 [Nicotiana tabacum]|uniref:Uncharacterized protein LOC107826073 n=2 Tax=Nicotiana tabacum TaxID=4097 RepID=A0AC58SMP5_TOBAC|nr:ER membrane protein complex subunit 1-like [Nicotiana tomentosiformis]
MAIRAFLLFLILLVSSYTTFALYEDQVGLMDWHQQYIGKVKKAVFQTHKAGRKRVVVSTEENVIAALDLRHGEIFWRQVLGVNDVIDEIDIALGKYVVTLSSGGSILRAWNLPDGQMVWESFLLGSNPSRSLLLTPANFGADKDNVILVYGSGYLHAVSSIDGDILWKKDLAQKGIDVHHLVHLEESGMLYALGVGDRSQFEAYVINVGNGELLKHSSMEFPGGFSGDLSLSTSDKAVALDSSGSILVTISFVGGEIKFQEVHISDLLQGFSGVAVLLPSKLAGMVAVKINRSLLFVKVKDEGTLEVVDRVPHVEAVSDSLSFAEGQTAFGLIQQDGGKIRLTVKSSDDWKTHFLKESIEVDQPRGLVHKVFINNYIRTDRTYGFRALIVMEDHSLLLLQQGAVVWYREDGLASIIDVTTSELPVEKAGVSVAKVEHNLFEWLKGHLLKLKATLMLATPDDVAVVQRMRLQSAEKSKMTRDHNGFRKLLIVLTRAGKLFALHTGDGRIVWSRLLNAFRNSGTCESPRGLKLHQWQVPHHHALDENPSVLVVGTCRHNSDASGILSFVDAYRGEELNYLAPVHSITQVIPLPFTDSIEQRLHLIIDAEGYGHLYPRTLEAVGIFQKELGNIYWYSVGVNNNLLKGHVVKKNCKPEIADDYCFESIDLWSVIFPSDSEKVIATSTRKLSEVVHTQAKVVAEDVLYKYISKNVLFLATVTPKAIGDIGSVIPEDSWLFVYLVDTITGRVLHRMSHHGCQGPVHAVFSENWVVYHYFNLRAHRYEMSVVEIYDQSRADNKDVLKLVLGKHNLSAPVSSYSRPEVMTKSQSYFFTHTVKTIAVTSTAKGITSKQLLIGTIGDQVLALDKRFLDPRRTLNPTQAEKEEGIIPLTDSLPIMPQAYVTHALKVEGLKSIITIPAKLESTTLVFAHGVDLFFTRLAPSKTYDSLTEDFNYALLLLTIVALVIAIFVTWIWSERKELQEKWR